MFGKKGQARTGSVTEKGVATSCIGSVGSEIEVFSSVIAGGEDVAGEVRLAGCIDVKGNRHRDFQNRPMTGSSKPAHRCRMQ